MPLVMSMTPMVFQPRVTRPKPVIPDLSRPSGFRIWQWTITEFSPVVAFNATGEMPSTVASNVSNGIARAFNVTGWPGFVGGALNRHEEQQPNDAQ